MPDYQKLKKRKKVVTLGEIMMRLTTPGKKRFVQADNFKVAFGGGEANVSVTLAQWGLDTFHVTAFPNNGVGNAAIEYLQETGVHTDYVFYSEGRMGLYFLEYGLRQRGSKIVYDRFDSSFSNFKGEEIDWDAVFDGADWFHWTGITPATTQLTANLTLKALEIATQKGLTVSGDVNYRRNLWQYGKGPLDVIPDLVKHTHVMVAGLTDFDNCLNIQKEDYVEACHSAMEQYPQLRYITSTSRTSISASHNKLEGYLWNGQELLDSKKYDIQHIVDRVGGGDAYLAGLVYGLLHYSDQDALEFAVASSALKHSVPGDANLVTLEEVHALVRGDNVGKPVRY